MHERNHEADVLEAEAAQPRLALRLGQPAQDQQLARRQILRSGRLDFQAVAARELAQAAEMDHLILVRRFARAGRRGTGGWGMEGDAVVVTRGDGLPAHDLKDPALDDAAAPDGRKSDGHRVVPRKDQGPRVLPHART